METRATTIPITGASPSPAEPAALSSITATIVTRTSLKTYDVVDLQVAGARLRGDPLLPVRRAFEVIVRVPHYPPIRVYARLDRPEDCPQRGRGVWISFIHTTDYTEDHIQAALLSELERRTGLAN